MAVKHELTSNQIRSIVARYKNGESSVKLAERFEVSIPTVLRILRTNKVKVHPRGRYAAS
jgi:hypothetical protein